MGQGKKGKRKKGGMGYIPYDYESAYRQSIESMNEWFIEQMGRYRNKTLYALKEIKAGDQFEVEIYPQFKNMDEVPEEGRRIVKDNSSAQKNLNDKNARKYLTRLINHNFGESDLWITLTYDDAHLPADGDIGKALKDVRNYIGRINYRRRKRGLKSAKYVYVIEYDEVADIRWHIHIVMDGELDMDTVEACWGQSSRNEVRRTRKDKDGLSGMAHYLVKEKKRIRSERRWNSSKGLKKPGVRVVHSKQPIKGNGSYKQISAYIDEMVKNQNYIQVQMEKWYPNLEFAEAEVRYNNFNYMFYIHARLRRKKE
ncbi:rolling circle replication-associated protein [Schaedlerella arabinosiphila]|uniref:rolling circle replication-associated protein n=1 Tax=Schaedlerella arabinosiphila TaxID=2044587 RepID=UPI002557EB9C|nr:hypothetical protein [Schaedlerella arabinosiphila]